VDANYVLAIQGGKLAADFEEGPGGSGPLGDNHPIVGNATISANVWHHGAATYDGTTWKLYLDGLLDAQLTVGEPVRSDNTQHGALATTLNSSGTPTAPAGGFFQGVLDEARVWNYARSDAQIAAGKDLEISSDTGLNGRWGMNEGAGTTVADSSGPPFENGATIGLPGWIGGFNPSGDVTPPAAPQDLVGTPGDQTVGLTWTANAEQDLAGYNVYRSTSSPVPLTTPINGAIPVVNNAYGEAGLTNGVTYYYVATAVDTSGNESGGSNEVSVIPESGTSGTALQFNGTNQYVTFGAASGLGTATFTIETWFKREGAGVGTNTGSGGVADAIPLVTKGRSEIDGTNVDMNYFLGIQASTNRLVADFEEGPGGPGPLGQNHPVIGTAVVTSGVWHHAAATYGGGTWRLYLDGNLDTTLPVTGSPGPRSDSIQHGALASALDSTGTAAGFFNGVLDEARVWNVVRDQAQIAATKNMEVPAASGLIGRWGLNEGSGTTVGDSSGGGNNGTATNGPIWVAGAPLSGGSPPATPLLNAPSDGETGVSTSPTLDVGVTDPDGDPMTVTYYGRQVTPPPAPDFTIVALPDTQHYADENLNYAYVAQFGAQTQWVVDTEATLNTEFVTHLGDVVEHIDQFDQEWIYASDAMAILDNAGMKNNLAPGNHDLTSQGVGSKFDQYFPPSRYDMHDWYGNYLGGNGEAINRLNKDNYELFEVGSMQFIVFHLEYDTPDYVINWTQDVLDQYPNRRAIITTHAFVNTSNARPTGVINRPDGRSPEYLWQNLVRSNCNVFLVLNGHFPGEGRRTDLNDCGQPVQQVLADYQSRANGGDGWLRYMTFKPSENKIYVYTFSPTLNSGAGLYETDANSQFVLDYSMQAANFEVIATNNGVASGTDSTALWSGLVPNTEYEWYVTVNDGASTTTGPTWTFTTGTDSDGDTIPDATDNCPAWPNPTQNLPPWIIPANDPDCDAFSTTVENPAGTDPLDACRDDSSDNAWPADINNDGFVDTGDIGRVTNDFADAVPADAPARHDIAPNPPDGFIDTGDIGRVTNLFGLGCS